MAKKIFLLLLLAACTTAETGKRASTGAVNELLIVTNDKAQWEGAAGDTLRAFFAAEMPGLPQPEPVFDITNVGVADFADLFQKYHNIFILDINPNAAESRSEIRSNVWSEPQRVITLTAPDPQSFYDEFRRNRDHYMQRFIELERERTLFINKIEMDFQLSEVVNQKFGLKFPFPEGFYVAKEAPDFMWLRYTMTKAKQDVELGILIYAMDYRDEVVFDPRHIIKWRNMITMQHIPGSAPQSYMTTSVDIIPPVFDTIAAFPGGFAVETRGLWKTENDFMGGPFISYTFIHQGTNRVFTLDGYVYNPNDDKKNFLRQLEAVFFAMEFTR